MWYCLKSLGDWKLVPRILCLWNVILSGNVIVRRQRVWIADMRTKLQRPEARSLSKSTEMPFILQRSWGRVACFQFSPSTAFFFLLVVGQLCPGHMSVSGKAVPNSTAPSCHSWAWSLLHPSSHAQMTFSTDNRASLFHSSELIGLLGDIILLTKFCSWFCNVSNNVFASILCGICF